MPRRRGIQTKCQIDAGYRPTAAMVSQSDRLPMITPTTGASVIISFHRSSELHAAEVARLLSGHSLLLPGRFPIEPTAGGSVLSVFLCREFGKPLKMVAGRSTMSERGLDSVVAGIRTAGFCEDAGPFISEFRTGRRASRLQLQLATSMSPAGDSGCMRFAIAGNNATAFDVLRELVGSPEHLWCAARCQENWRRQ